MLQSRVRSVFFISMNVTKTCKLTEAILTGAATLNAFVKVFGPVRTCSTTSYCDLADNLEHNKAGIGHTPAF